MIIMDSKDVAKCLAIEEPLQLLKVEHLVELL